MRVKPRLWPYEVCIRTTSCIKLDAQGLIRDHCDEWSVTSLLNNIPFAGQALNMLNLAVGAVTSQVVHILMPEKKPETPAELSR
jgi:hypothetical protein